MNTTCEVRSTFGSVHFETDFFRFRLHFLGAIGYFSDLSKIGCLVHANFLGLRGIAMKFDTFTA